MSHTFDTDEQRVSYGIGRQMGDQLLSSNIPDLTVELVLAGLRDVYIQQPSQVDEGDMQAAFQTLQAKMQALAEESARAAGKAGLEFLERNSSREGVITLPSGLQYEVISEGTGATPTASSTVDRKSVV